MEVRILRDGEDTGYKYLSCRLSATVDMVSQRCDLYLSRDSSFAVGQELGIEGDGVRLFSAPVVKVGPGRHSQLRIVAFAKLDEIVHVNYHQEDAANILSDIIEKHNYKSTGKRMDFALRGERMSLLHHWLDTVAPDKEAFMDAEGVLQVGLEPGSRVNLGKLIEEHGDWQGYRAVPVLLGQVSSQGIVRSLEYALRPTRERLRIWWGELKESAKDFDAVTEAAPTILPYRPPNVDIDANIQEAKTMSYHDFYLAVRSGGKWDYKKLGPQYEDFGNFNFGATGRALGLPGDILLRGAGWYQGITKTSSPDFGVWYGDPPYGDDPKDQAQIKKGILYYEIKYQ